MKLHINFLVILLILVLKVIQGQDFYFLQYENRSEKYFLVKYNNDTVVKKQITVGFNFHVASDSNILHAGLYEIFRTDFNNSSTQIYYKPEIDNSTNTPDKVEYLLSFDLIPNKNIYYEIGAETYRLEKNKCRLFKNNAGIETQIHLPNEMNFINFDISPDEQNIAFVHTIQTDITNICYLMLFNFETNKLDTIDNDYNFGYFLNRQITKWTNDKLYYLKRGKIYKFDLKTKVSELYNIPFENSIKDFLIINKDCYFISNIGLYKWNEDRIVELYRADKYDFLECLRTQEKNGL